ncbi:MULTISPECIES: hypothetical protein [unclassified Pasteurella]|uniref:hypothetical protein n=1 Tax=unclassified Pasteurella TaxID=2621516 RepID=UPI0010749578|nr:hypothetical protein [Pasteurella sp. 19428wF3_WM03]TFU49657.1 hypothetical protein E4T92_10435 [Pasteurella sp. WM03]
MELLELSKKRCLGKFDDGWAYFDEPIVCDVARQPIYGLILRGKKEFSETQKIIQNTTALSLPIFSFGDSQLLFSTRSQPYSTQLVSPRMVFQSLLLQNKNMWGSNAQKLNYCSNHDLFSRNRNNPLSLTIPNNLSKFSLRCLNEACKA